MVAQVEDDCGACGGSSYSTPPPGVVANIPGMCDITLGGCQCLSSWEVPNFAGTDACGSYSGCNNYDPATGMPCYGWYSNMSPADWQAVGQSYCKVDPSCGSVMSSDYPFAECVPPPTTDCNGDIMENPMAGGAPAVDHCGVCGGDGSSCGDAAAGGCLCEESWTVSWNIPSMNADDWECTDATGNSIEFSGCNNVNPQSGTPCNGYWNNWPASVWQSAGQSYCRVTSECQNPEWTHGGFGYTTCIPPALIDCAGNLLETPTAGGGAFLNGDGICVDDGSGANAGVNECGSLPCENGGTCIDSISSYTCVCTESFEGSNCQTATVTVNSCPDTEVPNSNRATTGSVSGVESDVVQVLCDPGFSGGGTWTCGEAEGAFSFSGASCVANSCTATEFPNSNLADTGSVNGVTNDVVAIVCDTGYTGGGDITCGDDGAFYPDGMFCVATACMATEVANSDYAIPYSINGVTGDSVAVTCDSGFEGGGDWTCEASGTFSTGVDCTNIDECATEQDDCSIGATCSDTDGSFDCVCQAGFQSVGGECVVATCDGSAVAPANSNGEGPTSDSTGVASTEQAIGSTLVYTCGQGFTQNGLTVTLACQQTHAGQTATFVTTDECGDVTCNGSTVDPADAPALADTPGTTMAFGSTLVFTCDPGYTGTMTYTCGASGEFTTASDACADSAADCPTGTTGTVPGTSGSGGLSGCTLNAGYEGSVEATSTAPFYTSSVADINECSLGSHNCDSHATCTNSAGSFSCACNDGYTGDGTNCDANACETISVPNSDGVDGVGGFTGDSVTVTCDLGAISWCMLMACVLYTCAHP